MKTILDLCGGTGAWSKPYAEAGYDVRIITLPENDVRLYPAPGIDDVIYGILAAPPCTEFSRAKHFHGKGKYNHDFISGLEVVSACMRIILMAKTCHHLEFWALENPVGYLSRWLGEPNYVFDAWEFGDPWQKRTALWGDFLLPNPTVFEKPDGLRKFSMLKSDEIYPQYYGILNRQERRAITPPGFAQAFFEANP